MSAELGELLYPDVKGGDQGWNHLVHCDLLYFGSSGKRITHTGLFIGDGQFINATTHERPVVRIDNLNDPYWVTLLVTARRVKP